MDIYSHSKLVKHHDATYVCCREFKRAFFNFLVTGDMALLY